MFAVIHRCWNKLWSKTTKSCFSPCDWTNPFSYTNKTCGYFLLWKGIELV